MRMTVAVPSSGSESGAAVSRSIRWSTSLRTMTGEGRSPRLAGGEEIAGPFAVSDHGGPEVPADQGRESGIEHPREGTIGAADPALLINHGDAFGEGVERGFPLFFRLPHHFEQPAVGHHHGDMGRHGRHEPEILGLKLPERWPATARAPIANPWARSGAAAAICALASPIRRTPSPEDILLDFDPLVLQRPHHQCRVIRRRVAGH